MQKTIISDTSCLILLQKIGELDLLQGLFQSVLITPEIANEYDLPLPKWIVIESPSNKTYQRILEASLDKGESSAIALCLEKTDPLLIIDDLKGRQFAENLGLKITGMLGILILAKRQNLISSVKPALEKVKKTDFRFSKNLEKTLLKLSGEE
jgi:predicted nucleic acid-binding protein